MITYAVLDCGISQPMGGSTYTLSGASTVASYSVLGGIGEGLLKRKTPPVGSVVDLKAQFDRADINHCGRADRAERRTFRLGRHNTDVPRLLVGKPKSKDAGPGGEPQKRRGPEGRRLVLSELPQLDRQIAAVIRSSR